MKNEHKPAWLKIKLRHTDEYIRVKKTVSLNKLHTICESGSCPNKNECWSRGVASFMILGDICTRSCKFCDVITGKPLPPDPQEPLRVARSIELMQLKSVVITSVDRDDLPDYGASFWAETIRVVKKVNPGIKIEALIPDFQGKTKLIDEVIAVSPEIISHNLETVRRLTPLVRSKAQYETSLQVLEHIARSGVVSKSGIMLGLGETDEEVFQLMDDLRKVDCQILTIGQYLQPSFENMEVVEYISPEKFIWYKNEGLKRGFKHVESAPLVRSSYYAEKHL
ncbi:MAG: lipoyl synthase [Bacteroidales bacterium]|nr:lipoyl synthase [Bacteroidales bacterium]